MTNLHYDYLKDYLALVDSFQEKISKFSWDDIPRFNYDGDDPDEEDRLNDEHRDLWGYEEDPKRMARIASRFASEFEAGPLKELNTKYKDSGLSESLLRAKLPMKDAINQSGAWYNSSCW